MKILYIEIIIADGGICSNKDSHESTSFELLLVVKVTQIEQVEVECGPCHSVGNAYCDKKVCTLTSVSTYRPFWHFVHAVYIHVMYV